MIFNLLPLVVLVAPVFCQNNTNAANTQETCTTEFATTSPAQVSTTTQVTTTTLVDTQMVTSTPSVFINTTASTVYQTTILTSTATETLSQITDTYSFTSTVFETSTISSTIVSTVSETITTTVSQITIAPSAGFTPLGSVFPTTVATITMSMPAKKIKREVDTDQCFCIAEGSSSGSGSGSGSGSAASLFGAGEPSSKYTSTLGCNSRPVQTSTITVTTFLPFPIGTSTTYTSMTKPTFTASNSSTMSYTVTNGSIVASPTQYPSKVYCSSLVQITSTSTVTYAANSTITNYITPPVSTSTVSSTYITTSTYLPVDASVTVTVFSTSTVPSITFIPSTTTQTITLTVTQLSGPTPTFYEACAANNLISNINGGLEVYQFSSNYETFGGTGFSAASGYDCCVACQTTLGCGGSGYSDAYGFCYLLDVTDVCDPSVTVFTFDTYGTGLSTTLSNGPCGQGAYSGPLSF